MIGRKLYEYVRLHCIDINPVQRNNIIKMNSLMHNQLPSKEFNAMIKYMWYDSGYLTVYSGNFTKFKQISFTRNDPNLQCLHLS